MYALSFTPSAEDDFRFLKKAEQVLILDAVEEQLTHEPGKETRNRKSLRPNDLANWELRVGGTFRVFYDIDKDKQEVLIKAVGWKEHNQLFIRGKEHQL